MRRLLFLIGLLGTALFDVCAQSKVYVTFTSIPIKEDVVGVHNSELTRKDRDRDIPHLFILFDRAGGDSDKRYFFYFVYENLTDMPDTPSFYLSPSSLSNVPLIDWDKVSGKVDAEAKYQTILSYDEIYFVDRTESTSSRLKVYPVKLFKLKEY